MHCLISRLNNAKKQNKKNNTKQNKKVMRRYSCQSVQTFDIGVKKINNAFKFSKKKNPKNANAIKYDTTVERI